MRLPNGAVLPFGLLGADNRSESAAQDKGYRNYGLKVGIITATYPVAHEKNYSKLTTEYDVIAFEQNEDRGATPINYRNCLSAEGLGSMADFFEATKRSNNKKNKDESNTKNQNGSVVLILCRDGVGDHGIIIGCLTHPDRKTTLKDDMPHLEGEYNGVNIVINADGSCSLTFKGATDNDGKIIDTKQGPTKIDIEKDGSFQIKHDKITQRLARDGKASLTAEDDISNTTKKNFLVTATESITMKATKDFNLECVKLVAKASGSAMLECQKLEVKSESEIMIKGQQLMVEAEAMAKIKSTTITLDGLVFLGGDGGQPVLLLSTQFIGIGNLGAPVLSNAISGYAIKVMAQ